MSPSGVLTPSAALSSATCTCGEAPTYKCLLENEQCKHREFGVATNVDLSVTKFTKQINASTVGVDSQLDPQTQYTVGL